MLCGLSDRCTGKRVCLPFGKESNFLIEAISNMLMPKLLFEQFFYFSEPKFVEI